MKYNEVSEHATCLLRWWHCFFLLKPPMIAPAATGNRNGQASNRNDFVRITPFFLAILPLLPDIPPFFGVTKHLLDETLHL
jgi:hypothetical protein